MVPVPPRSEPQELQQLLPRPTSARSHKNPSPCCQKNDSLRLGQVLLRPRGLGSGEGQEIPETKWWLKETPGEMEFQAVTGPDLSAQSQQGFTALTPPSVPDTPRLHWFGGV